MDTALEVTRVKAHGARLEAQGGDEEMTRRRKLVYLSASPKTRREVSILDCLQQELCARPGNEVTNTGQKAKPAIPSNPF